MLIDAKKLPNETQMIFDSLRNGNFIVDNHPDTRQRRLFAICENYFDTLTAYFQPLGYDLERGDGYFLFYTQGMNETTKEYRMNQLLVMLDLVELLIGSFPTFSVGWTGSPSELEMSVKNDTARREQLEKMRSAKGKTLLEKSNSVFNSMVKFGCFVPLDDKYNRYMLCSSYNYIKEFYESVVRINSVEEQEDEEL